MVDGEETKGEKKETVEEEQPQQEELKELKEDKGKEVAQADDDEDDEEDFNAFDEEEDDDDDDNDDDVVPEGEVEVDDLNEPGTSQKPKRKRHDDDDGDDNEAAEIVAGLSGDEVDPSNIIEGGRGARRGRYASGAGGSGAKKYIAKAEVASDEDSW
ncbi:hypothetical protein M9435_004236 [Picochlorum sp. BPE23]|nr:hypothetical protein M9435_004236 [Picochlorum sp. BPE23]